MSAEQVGGLQDHPRWGRLPDLGLDDRYDRLVVVAAHPDDESIGAGGLIARAHDRGMQVYVALLTAGEAADPAVTDGSRHALARMRLAEMEAAVSLLAPGAPVVFLGAQDGHLDECEPQVAAYLAETLGQGGRTLVAAPWREDPHPDHRSAGRAAATAAAAAGARLVEFPVRLWLDADPGEAPWDRMVQLSLTDAERDRKVAAIGAHVSQVRSPDVLRSRLAHLAGTVEHHVLEPAAVPDPVSASDPVSAES